jgi:uncharacterized membrane protein
METVTVWKFDTPDGADDALAKLEKLKRELLIELHDAAVVTWEPGRKKPNVRQMNWSPTAGALGGSFFGLLLGLIFFVPVLGIAIGAAGGAVFGHLKEAGIGNEFITEVRDKVTPGTSALFAVTSEAVFDKVMAEFSDTKAELVRTNLTDEQEAKLREAFGED